MDTSYDSKRSRSYYADEIGRESDRMSTDYYRGDSRTLSKSSASYTRGGGREREYVSSATYEKEFDRGIKRYKDDRGYDDYAYASGRSERPSVGTSSATQQTEEYRTLCLSNLNPRIQDTTIKEAINQEFRKFGEFKVKIVRAGEHRIAYVNFRYAEDARDAKYARSNKLFLFDMPTRIDAVYPKNRRGDSPEFTTSSTYGREAYGSSVKSLSPQGRMSGRHEEAEIDSRTRDYNRRGYENKSQDGPRYREHKFPHHLHHIQPEDDENATRTLFVGNLDLGVSDADLRSVFERYGEVQDIDIKRPSKSQGNTYANYAFVKFANLDMAHRAKVDMSGRYIGKLQCKIGYGKVNPTTCVWVGGLGPWISLANLEAEFDRFGVIHRAYWPEGKNYAYFLYDSQDAAQAACKAMRGIPLGGSDRRLRVDFTDPALLGGQSEQPERGDGRAAAGPALDTSQDQYQNKAYYSRTGARDHPDDDPYKSRREDPSSATTMDKWKQTRGRYDDDPSYRTRQSSDYPRGYSPSRDRHDGRTSPTSKRPRLSGSSDPYNDNNYNRHHSSNGNYSDRAQQNENALFDSEPLTSALSVVDMANSLPVVWSGALVLKTSAFPTRMHLVDGNVRLVDTLMRDHTTTEMSMLKITQRLRLDQPKLDDMGNRVAASGPNGYSILLAMPGSESSLEDANAKVQHRPLRNLVSYLKQKEAAGVISLPPNTGKDQELGVLHAFPPCQFGQEYLQRRAPKLGSEPSKEDHLVIIVVGGSA